MLPHTHVVIFARVPQLGHVKTRLAASLGQHAALAAYRELTEHTLMAVNASRPAHVVVYFTPADNLAEMQQWLGRGTALTPQVEGDLGARMSQAVVAQLDRGAKHVVIVGTDCPWIGARHIQGAVAALSAQDIALGPALDGGYYLIAMAQPHVQVFRDVPWSAANTRDITLQRAAESGLTVHLLEPLRDVDTESDWLAWCAARASGDPT